MMLIRDQQEANQFLDQHSQFQDSMIRDVSISYSYECRPTIDLQLSTRDYSDRTNPIRANIKMRLQEVDSFRIFQPERTTLARITSGIQIRVFEHFLGIEFGGYANEFLSIEELRQLDCFAIGARMYWQQSP